MIVYIPVEPSKKKTILENGIDINKDYNKKIGLYNLYVKCISGFLTPEKTAQTYVAVNVDIKKLYIANYDLWLAYKLSENEIFNKMYIESIVDVKKYRFGEYRVPEVLIMSSVKKEDIADPEEMVDIYDKIFLQNDKIYIDCLVEKIFQNTSIAKSLIVDYFIKLSGQNSDITAQIVEKGNSRLYVFVSKKDERAWTIEI